VSLPVSARLWNGAGVKRICVIGDSSVAALKVAWDAIGAEMPDVALTFFAAPGKTIAGLVVDGGTLAAGSDVLREHLIAKSGGADRIDPAGFDAYVLSGMALNAFPIARVRADFPGQDMTAGVVVAAASARVADTIHGQTVQKLRACTKSPFVMLPRPFRVIDPQKDFWKKLARTNNGSHIGQLFESGCARFAAQRNGRFVPQPRETVGKTGVDTRPRFARGVARFFDGAGDDLTHMNGDYGAVVLRAALAALG
jgi:hypothetical protein